MRLHVAGGGRVDFDSCAVMAILNATPDSFSDGGALADPGALEARIDQALGAGADILDVGGESTRPGHAPVAAEEEIARVVPVIQAIRRIDPEVPISIDTQKADVAKAALAAGASFVNDVSGLSDAGMAEVVRAARCSIVLMRRDPIDGDIVSGCRTQLQTITGRAIQAGIAAECIIVDPGLGFGQRPGASVEDNLALVDGLREYAAGYPVLIGASRKRFIGTMMGESDPRRRVAGSIEVARRAALAGASIVRVHDVADTVAALRV